MGPCQIAPTAACLDCKHLIRIQTLQLALSLQWPSQTLRVCGHLAYSVSKDAVSDYLLLCHLQLSALYISPPLGFLPCSDIPSLPPWFASLWLTLEVLQIRAHFKSVVSSSGQNYAILWKIIKESMGSEHELCTFQARLTKGTGLLYTGEREVGKKYIQ